MKNFARAVLVLACTLGLLSVLLLTDPFAKASDLLDKAFGAPPRWTQVENLVRSPQTQEVSHGERPYDSLRFLASYWKTTANARKIFFIGNSQMQEVSLAPGEGPSARPEETYVDLISDDYKTSVPQKEVYRLSAPGMSYTEALWYVQYLGKNPDLRPDMIVLQINYQAFWRDGIRDGMLQMLDDSDFRAEIEQQVKSGRLYSEEFQAALDRFAELRAKSSAASDAQSAGKGKLGFNDIAAFGAATHLEDSVRGDMNRYRFFRERSQELDSLLQMLYRIRLYVLRIKPTDARSIGGVRLLRSQAALDQMAALCRRQNIDLIFFYAPLNPRVTLYGNSQDERTYHSFVSAVSGKYHIPVYDFERSVPPERWGRLLNGPDPLHMGREAQHMVADMMRQVIDKEETAANAVQ